MSLYVKLGVVPPTVSTVRMNGWFAKNPSCTVPTALIVGVVGLASVQEELSGDCWTFTVSVGLVPETAVTGMTRIIGMPAPPGGMLSGAKPPTPWVRSSPAEFLEAV